MRAVNPPEKKVQFRRGGFRDCASAKTRSSDIELVFQAGGTQNHASSEFLGCAETHLFHHLLIISNLSGSP